MLLCTEYSKEKCGSFDCSYVKGGGVYTNHDGEKTSSIDSMWLEDMENETNFVYCGFFGGKKMKVIVINSLLEYCMKDIIKKHEESKK